MKAYNFDFSDMNNITDIYAVKILLCYFLNKVDRPVAPNLLLEICTSSNIVNYFSYNHAVESMLENGLIEEVEFDGENAYRLTEKGKIGAEEFKTMAPKSARERILAEGLRLFTRIKNENTVTFEISETEKGCEVKCVCVDNDLKLMELTLFAPDMEQAELVRKKIRMNPQAFYGKIMDYVLDNEDFVPEISD